MPTRPYPDRARSLRAVHRRREAYQRTVIARYSHCIQRVVLGLDVPGPVPPYNGPTTADVLAPYLEHEARLQARARVRTRQLQPAFQRLYLNSRITSLDT
jgi:hypothetical protein